MNALRPLAYLLLGFLAPLALAWLARVALPGAWAPGPPRVWACDREAGRVVALDAALYERASAPLFAPVAVAARGDGGAWALDAVERRGGGPHRLVRLDADARVRAERMLPGPALLAALGDAAVVLVEAGADPATLLVVDPSGASTLRREVAARHGPATALACAGGRALIGFADGALLAHDVATDGDLVALHAARGPVVDLAPAPGGGWWVLRGGEAPRVALHAASLAPRWEQALDLRFDRIAPVPGSERAWLVSSASGEAAAVGERGRIEARLRDPPRGGLRGAAGVGSGGARVAAPGAVLELDAHGEPVRAQGGFDFLVALAGTP